MTMLPQTSYSTKTVTGPTALPIVGNFFELRRDPMAFLSSLSAYGSVTRFKMLTFDVYVVNEPDLIEEMLVKTNDRDFAKTPPNEKTVTAQLFGKGILTSTGEMWRRQRRLAQPAFHRQKIAGYAETMVARTQELLATWHNGETRNLQHDMMQVTLRIVVKTLFGAELKGQEARVEKALYDVMTAFGGLGNSLWLLLQTFGVPTPASSRFKNAIRELDVVVYEIIAQRRAQADAHPADDLLSMLLQAQDEDGTGMSDQQLRDEVITMFIAGHETTALALTWALHLLATHPAQERVLVEELATVLAGRTPTLADLPALRYTDAVMKESMRLYPPVWMVDGRIALRDYQLGDYRIPKGALVAASQWVTHRDSRFFTEPTRFHPDRWLNGSTDTLHKYAYFPFGGGQRQCIGNTFASMEAVLLLATIAQAYRFTPISTQTPTLAAAITLRPKGGMLLRLEKRENASTISVLRKVRNHEFL